jgi:hypothetical protein
MFANVNLRKLTEKTTHENEELRETKETKMDVTKLPFNSFLGIIKSDGSGSKKGRG